MRQFFAEGDMLEFSQTKYTPEQLYDALNTNAILEARTKLCTPEHDLIVELGCMEGIIPRDECAIGISEGYTRDIAIISRVGKPVCFTITKLLRYEDGRQMAVLSRKNAQLMCKEQYLDRLRFGDIVKAKITHLESFGAFVDIGAGLSALLPIDQISISRISHPKNRFVIGDTILAVVKSRDHLGRITLSHKELLGTWEENAAKFQVGQTVSGIIRSVESYGIFIELVPNLAGLAEPVPTQVHIGQGASAYIKSMSTEKMKVKLVLVDTFEAPPVFSNIKYFITSGNISYWRYSPPTSQKVIESYF